jgi:hypothetical protein
VFIHFKIFSLSHLAFLVFSFLFAAFASHKCITTKQWLLAGKFASANFANVASVDVVTRQNRRHSPSRFASTRQTRRHLPKAILEKNVTRLAKFALVTRESREFGASSHRLITTPGLRNNACYKGNLICGDSHDLLLANLKKLEH